MKRHTARTLVQAATLGTICAALVAAPAFTRQEAGGAGGAKKDEPNPGSAQPTTPPAPTPTPAPAPTNPSSQPDKPAPKPDTPAPTNPAPSTPGGTSPTSPSDQPATNPPTTPPSTTPSTTTPPAKPADAPPKPPPPRDPDTGRVVQADDMTPLTFKGVTVEQVLPFIMEATGKVVVPRPELLGRKVTVLSDQKIKRSRALDLVFFALQQEGIAVIETKEMVILINIADLVKGDVPVLGPDDSTLKREDFGTVVEKIFQMRNGSAKNVVEALEEAKTLPDYAKVTLDNNTNQIVVMGNIGLLQRIEKIVNAMDQRSSEALSTETFHLKYADAEKISSNIRELFSEDSSTNRNQGQQNQGRNFGFFPQQDQQRQRGRGQGANNQDSVLSQNLRVTANTQQNAVTVLAEKRILDQIADAVYNEWDLPLEPGLVVPKVYQLKYIDPVKVRDVLDSLFGKGGGTTAAPQQNQGGRGQFGGQQQQSSSSSGTSQGVGRLAGQFTFEAIPDASKIVVIAKSPDNIEAIDKIIEELDKPNNAGLPTIIELKHASAEELAEQVNTLLAQEGTLAQLNRAETGLTANASSQSPFADTSTTSTTTNNNTTTNAANNTSIMRFWWANARVPTDFAGTSNLVGKLRIVPVWRQNAVMLISPPEYREAITTIIDKLDQPGRQVLISGIVFEISLDDSTALGVRWSNAGIVPTSPDNAVNIGNTVSGTKGNLINDFFDTSVLQTTANLNVLIQALAQKTNVHILSEPRIFTSDNQEADFFSGQDIPFVNELQNNNVGNPTQSFTYRAVGIRLAVRPRITVKKDVDLRVNLTLSSVAPGQSNTNAFIIDRRETNTHLIVQNGQTVVISGIIRREDSQITRKIPLLGDLPLVGAIFTSIEYEHSNTELIAFVTPIVMENTDEATKVYEKDRDRLSEMRNDLDAGKDHKKSEATNPDKILPPPGYTDNPAPPAPPPDGKKDEPEKKQENPK